ncbi:Cyclin-A2-1 [Vitis vinifera]|uniref:Cyclin-A2-1 n=1 Tax=Vitis vinifera TaxID=29760 RepID=A0A438F279_VITVI|nr:Cyclin-A2-1 [Vitis vinifera]
MGEKGKYWKKQKEEWKKQNFHLDLRSLNCILSLPASQVLTLLLYNPYALTHHSLFTTVLTLDDRSLETLRCISRPPLEVSELANALSSGLTNTVKFSRVDCSSTRHIMNKENITSAKIEEPTVRITRARAKAATKSGGLLPPKPPIKLDEMQVVRTNSKRPASNENKPSATANAGLQHKRRATLKDVTNVVSENSYMNCISTTKVEARILSFFEFKRAKRGPSNKSSKVALTVLVETPQVQEDAKTKVTGETSNIRTVETQDSTLLVNLEEDEFIQHTFSSIRTSDVADPTQLEETSIKPAQHQILSEEEEDNLFKAQGSPNGPCIADIDSDHKDPQMCSLYASDIYDNFLCRELDRRPSANFMDSVQRDITPNMRGILVDWLVEVSEEYKLVPDTLYLTVNLIDRFLSKNYIEKQRLQLLGVTCMLIASKYEEICAPHVEEFCFITDNTYTREEVCFLLPFAVCFFNPFNYPCNRVGLKLF